MPKSAVIKLPFGGLVPDIPLKKLSLFFDSIYINDFSFRTWKIDIEYFGNLPREEKQNSIQEIEWLFDNGILKPYAIEAGEYRLAEYDDLLAEDIKEVGKRIDDNLIREHDDTNSDNKPKKGTPPKLRFVGVLRANNDLIFNMEDIAIRFDALWLSLNDASTQFVPIINSLNSYKRKVSSDLALNFMLDKIPIPNVNTSWEQLIEFRSDEDIRRKYYALIDWINEMSRTGMPITHLADKYNHLYSEYLKQYSLHKLSSNFTTIELLVVGGVEFISSILQQNYLSAFRNILSVSKQKVILMKSEKELQGRELAYIHSVNEIFG